MPTAASDLGALGGIGFIGAGGVGAALARALAARGARITHIAARHPEHAAALARILPAANAATPAALASACDLVFLAVPDDAIGELAADLPWHAGQGVIHLSGARGAEALDSVLAHNALPAALHPLMTFPPTTLSEPLETTLQRLAGCAWALEAPDAALRATLEQIVTALDGQVIPLKAADRIPYHLAGVFASNYVVALLSASVALWQSFGVESETALHALLPLLRGALENLERNGLPQALSGPLARGDIGTIAAHLAWLDQHATADANGAALRDAYIALAKLALPIALAKGSLTPEAAAAIRALLTHPSSS